MLDLIFGISGGIIWVHEPRTTSIHRSHGYVGRGSRALSRSLRAAAAEKIMAPPGSRRGAASVMTVVVYLASWKSL